MTETIGQEEIQRMMMKWSISLAAMSLGVSSNEDIA